MEPIILRGEPPKTESSGSGYGDGYGSGSCYGSGYGDGYGSGSGYGYGSGSGSDSGYGSKEYWLATIPHFATKWTPQQQDRLRAAQKDGVTLAFWRSSQNGLPFNGGGKIEAAAPGVIHTVAGPLNLCHRNTLHATVIPPKWNGKRWWIVAMHGDVIWDEDKCGALKREIIGECL